MDILPPTSPGPYVWLCRPGSHPSSSQQGAADAWTVKHRKGHAPAHLALLREGAEDHEENPVAVCLWQSQVDSQVHPSCLCACEGELGRGVSCPVAIHVVTCTGQVNVLECTRATKAACYSQKGPRDCLTVQSSSDEKAKAQRGQETCSGLHSELVAELSGSYSVALTSVRLCVSMI